jgi:signal transduction histidine kinase
MLQSLRSKVFAFLSCLMLVSLFGVAFSFYITQQVNVRLSEINLRSVPMQRELTQLASDTDLLKRELDRSLGFSHWSDARWKPRRIPVWALEVHRVTLERIKADELNTPYWKDWYSRILRLNGELGNLAEQLYLQLQAQNMEKASELYPEWLKQTELLQKEVEWAKREIDRETRTAFQEAQNDVQTLRFALQMLLLAVIGVALIMVWMGERALRPLGHLRKIIQQITERGALTSQERAELPVVPLHQKDEVSDLAREFYKMATTLIEREKTVEFQKVRLEDQNKTLMQMGELQKRLQQAEHLAAVGRLSAQVAHEVGNPLHSIGLEAEMALDSLSAPNPEISVKQSMQSILRSVERLQKIIQNYLRLSRLSPERHSPVDLNEVVESVLATYANSLQKFHVKVDWRFDTELKHKAMVWGDQDLLEYAFGNLIRNSLQALEAVPAKDRKIVIGLTSFESNRIGILFEDSGTGISREAQENLFKPFFTTKAQGTGLGLSFVKKVFDDLGGEFGMADAMPQAEMATAKNSIKLSGARFFGFLKTAESVIEAGRKESERPLARPPEMKF